MRERVADCVGKRSVLCAVSGGTDSVVLLHLLLSLGVRVEAAHVEHGIRGEHSMRDCDFVTHLCKQWGVALHVAHIDVPGEAKKRKQGIEETAREMRYAYLVQTARARGLDRIATAHHQNDQAETLLLHIIRGTSPQGLSGMRKDDGTLIRPLLPFPRIMLEQYALQHSLPFVQDETNEDTDYARNYVRHELLPHMLHLNPRAIDALGRLSALSAQQNDYLLMQANAVLDQRMQGEALGDVSDLHPGLKGIVLRQYLVRLGLARDIKSSDIDHIQALFAMSTGSRVSLGKELFERDTKGIRRVIMKRVKELFALYEGINRTPLGDFTLWQGPVPDTFDLGSNTQVFDACLASGMLQVRTRLDGDRIALLGGGTKKISDVFTDQKVPRALRDGVPLIVKDDRIIWAVGIAPSATCAVTPDSASALYIQYNAPKE